MPPRRFAPRLRILFDDAIAIGPGKADLLDAIAETGRRLGMSYRRAWLLVETMNRCFSQPLVRAAKGGRRGGGARLSATGVDVLARYRAMEERAARALTVDMATFSRLLKARRSEH